MKIKPLLIGPFPPPISGVALANQSLYRGLKKLNIKSEIINTENQAVINNEIGKFKWSKLNFIKLYLDLPKLFTFNQIYITIGQSFFGVLKYLPFIFIAKILNKTTIVHLHGGHLYDNYNQQNKLKKALMLITLKGFNSGIVLSESLKTQLNFFLPQNKIHVVQNFFENHLHNIENQKDNTYDELKLVYLGNLIESKGINILLSALDCNELRNVKIKIAGNIPIENNAIKNTFRRFPNLEYLGVVSGEKKTNLLNWANVFCLPTYYPMEGQPISIIEAMSFGNLILTTKHGGIPDICCEQNGVFVEKENAEDLRVAIKHLQNNPCVIQEKGTFNKTYAQENFTEDKFIHNIIKVFENV